MRLLAVFAGIRVLIFAVSPTLIDIFSALIELGARLTVTRTSAFTPPTEALTVAVPTALARIAPFLLLT